VVSAGEKDQRVRQAVSLLSDDSKGKTVRFDELRVRPLHHLPCADQSSRCARVYMYMRYVT
jgi:hypothetical protein